ncbi:HAD-IIB family hydrolase [Endozoicomonas numazuensis]|uniref:Hydrolase n=1 Tax=Endozoicomonas numazuensis TaxID=1137799 RepID=A0A081NFS3_9GAMM|nr:HAD-IIB family hydrolase [Endozoicomonas numazuensis]KEQ17296.1 hydrolase [Endozoicomonas numazuensis]
MTKLNQDWKNVEWVLTDVDDTLTCDGHLPPETLIALKKLQDADIKVIAVTGACAGWCDHIAQLWPVDAVLGENGAFILEKKEGFLTIQADRNLEEIRQKQNELKAEVLEILKDYPELNLTLDQSYRLCEVAIDIGQNRPKVDHGIIEEIVARIHKLGAHATASSIHINAWYGEHSKRVTSLGFLEAKGLSQNDILTKTCYAGDSMNDQQMFEHLPLSVGVANIKKYWDKLSHKPSVVMSKPGGYGFAEFTEALLALKA